MIYSIQCPDGSVLSGDLGAIGCVVGGAYVAPTSINAAVGVVGSDAMAALTVADVEQLMGLSLAVVATAWGFKKLGQMLFKGA